ncbi:serine protease 46-like isoform X1 [Talpa occidentalis]|uniref:serine protease 46-like isoform X1 n=2 Tax=Talpa occidentalis TaxID=50954 RepID=UPI00188DFB8A|nr:serine protease 46-like isoform X1 [Talpa occidentalis]
MACGSGDLQGPPFASARLTDVFYVDETWFRGCGQTNLACKMVKGKLEEVGKWPWQVSILFMGAYICSGTLIHLQWVLTAAHCLQRSKDPRMYSVNAGIENLSENVTQLQLSRIVIHEDFSNLISQDIALLKLKDDISWSPLIQPVCLPNQKLKPSIGTMCWVIGWGHVNTRDTTKAPQSLQEMAVKIVNNEVCNKKYQFLFLKDQKKFIGQDVLCATAYWGLDSCQDNSGSPLVCQMNKTWIQMGVVSWSFGCTKSRFLGIYTSTSYFTPWIKRQVKEMKFTSRATSAFLSPVFLTGYILLVSLGSLWLL